MGVYSAIWEISGRRLPISWVADLPHHCTYRSVYSGSIVFTILLDNSQAWRYSPAWLLFYWLGQLLISALSSSNHSGCWLSDVPAILQALVLLGFGISSSPFSIVSNRLPVSCAEAIHLSPPSVLSCLQVCSNLSIPWHTPPVSVFSSHYSILCFLGYPLILPFIFWALLECTRNLHVRTCVHRAHE